MEKQRLIESGFVSHWMNELIADAARAARREKRESEGGAAASGRQDFKVESGKVVLSLHHLQGVFYLLAVGFSGAFLALLLELLVHCCGGRVRVAQKASGLDA
ncbi:uncharacterized protein LOC119592068 [Penaeus monodon]|uniref:uncharacterized protein LOC119592068 n=1 Tax=Penaeus monodon TaxID=6687 RepID=UPI0018A7BA43|nr:uncharacterized protein LOC119592068 [Penaeus monodon]